MIVTKFIEFDMAHRLPEYCGKCQHIHGHRFKLGVSYEGDIIKAGPYNGMVVDFNVIKQKLGFIDSIFDHSLTLYKNDPYVKNLVEMYGIKDDDAYSNFMQSDSTEMELFTSESNRFNLVNYIPTSENLVKHIAQMLGNFGIKLVELELWETPTSKSVYKL